jgi:cytochrome c biogenesis protein CcdA
MLLLLTGASGAGKSSVRELVKDEPAAEVDCVELGHIVSIPRAPTIAWRQQATEAVVQRALALQDVGHHLLLAGDPVAAGEVIAAPSADILEAIAVCLLDIDADAQAWRLAERGDDPSLFAEHQAFASWMGAHAPDPTYMPDVLSTNGPAMRSDRLTALGPPRGGCSMHVLATSRRTPTAYKQEVTRSSSVPPTDLRCDARRHLIGVMRGACVHARLVSVMLKLAIAVVAIALADCINPSLIAGELLLATGAHPRRRTATFTLAAWIVTFVFGVAFALGLGDLILALLPKPGPTVKYALIAAAGFVLVIGGTVVWVRRGALVSDDPEEARSAASGSSALFGATIAGLELLTAFPYFAAIAMIVGSGVSNPEKLALLALYCIVYTLPLIAIAAIFALMGKRAEDMLRPVGDWLFLNWPVVVGPLTAVLGFGVLVYGIVQLA